MFFLLGTLQVAHCAVVSLKKKKKTFALAIVIIGIHNILQNFFLTCMGSSRLVRMCLERFFGLFSPLGLHRFVTFSVSRPRGGVQL